MITYVCDNCGLGCDETPSESHIYSFDWRPKLKIEGRQFRFAMKARMLPPHPFAEYQENPQLCRHCMTTIARELAQDVLDKLK